MADKRGQRDTPTMQALVPQRVHARNYMRLLPGQVYTSEDPDTCIVTVLGSCIAACIRNPFTGQSGMNHFMLPESHTGDWNGSSEPGRYGNFAMDLLVDSFLKTGCRREDLEIKLFGGADLYPSSIQVGALNVKFITSYLMTHRLTAISQDLGGTIARKLIFSPATGQVFRQTVHPHETPELAAISNDGWPLLNVHHKPREKDVHSANTRPRR